MFLRQDHVFQTGFKLTELQLPLLEAQELGLMAQVVLVVVVWLGFGFSRQGSSV